jgi:hypothetical protein
VRVDRRQTALLSTKAEQRRTSRNTSPMRSLCALSKLEISVMNVGTIHLSARSKQLYAERRTERQRLRDLRMGYGSRVRAFVRPRRRAAPAEAAAATAQS